MKLTLEKRPTDAVKLAKVLGTAVLLGITIAAFAPPLVTRISETSLGVQPMFSGKFDASGNMQWSEEADRRSYDGHMPPTKDRWGSDL